MSLSVSVQHKIDNKTKPIGALGELEVIAKQIALIQNTLTPELNNPHLLVFAGDHGIAHEQVSAYPQEVTWQMVMNFVAGGAAINVFSQQHEIQLKVIDAGVNYDFPADLPIENQKVAKGTQSFLKQAAMTPEQLDQCLANGQSQVKAIAQTGCNVIGFGEMGIANTAAASALFSQFTSLTLEDTTGRGTGLNDDQLSHKLNVLKAAFKFHGDMDDPKTILQTFGGFEIAQMVGAMLEAKQQNMVIMVDGFIATAAFLAATKLDSSIKDYGVFCHQSNESGHVKVLDYLNAKPILNMGMRLGEGTGCALAYPIIKSAVKFLNEMASFDDAGVSKGE